MASLEFSSHESMTPSVGKSWYCGYVILVASKGLWVVGDEQHAEQLGHYWRLAEEQDKWRELVCCHRVMLNG